MVCSACGYENLAGHRFCGMCGVPLPHRPLTAPGANSTLDLTRVPLDQAGSQYSAAGRTGVLAEPPAAASSDGVDSNRSGQIAADPRMSIDEAVAAERAAISSPEPPPKELVPDLPLEEYVKSFRYEPPRDATEITMRGDASVQEAAAPTGDTPVYFQFEQHNDRGSFDQRNGQRAAIAGCPRIRDHRRHCARDEAGQRPRGCRCRRCGQPVGAGAGSSRGGTQRATSLPRHQRAAAAGCQVGRLGHVDHRGAVVPGIERHSDRSRGAFGDCRRIGDTAVGARPAVAGCGHHRDRRRPGRDGVACPADAKRQRPGRDHQDQAARLAPPEFRGKQ